MSKRDKEKPQQIQVFVRVRPINKQERDARFPNSVDILSTKELALKQQHGKHYTFDKVFGPNAKQLDVYTDVVKPLIAEVLAGYNCTVFAYGQTGTGKTYTMAGGSVFCPGISWQDDEDAGIIPRSLAHLFDELRLIQQEYTVRVSYLELYNEELYDLLSDTDDGRIRLFEDQRQKGSVIIQGIEEQTVLNKNEVYKILEKGQEKRRTASTLVNAQSSRSHTVFCITVHTRETNLGGEELVKTGKLNLVDLAGSENVNRSGAVERRAREAGSINQSLLTLGRVIKALVERSPHVPYRESKLTRILQDSLGGRTKTSIIATISPAHCCYEETVSTLEYANRARNITNRPEVNQRVSGKTLISQYADEIERLRKDLNAQRTGDGVYLAQENYDRLVTDRENNKEELAEKIIAIRELEQQIKIKEEQKNITEARWIELQESFATSSNELRRCRSLLRQAFLERAEQEHLATCYEKKAESLHEQAQLLLNMTETASINESILRKKIEWLFQATNANSLSVKHMTKEVSGICDDMVRELIDFMENSSAVTEDMSVMLQRLRIQAEEEHKEELSNTCTVLKHIKAIINSCSDLRSHWETRLNIAMDKIVSLCDAGIRRIHKMHKESSNGIQGEIKKLLALAKDHREQYSSKLQYKLREIDSAVTCMSINAILHLTNLEDAFHSNYSEMFVNYNEHKQLMEKAKSQLTEFNEVNDLLNRKMQALQETMEESAKLMDHCNSLAESTAQTVEREFQIVQEDIAKSTDHTVHIINNLAAADREEHDEENSRTEFIHNACDDMLFNDTFKHQTVAGELQQVDNAMKRVYKSINESFKAMPEPQREILKYVNYVEALTTGRMSTTPTKISEFNRGTERIMEKLSKLRENNVKCERSLSTNLHKCREGLTSFASSKLVEATHTGDTPVRSHYILPENLNYPSPREHILQKFRERHMQRESSDGSQDLPTPPRIKRLSPVPPPDMCKRHNTSPTTTSESLLSDKSEQEQKSSDSD